jgi:hypothetical protein
MRFEAGAQNYAALNPPLTLLPIPPAWSAIAPRVVEPIDYHRCNTFSNPGLFKRSCICAPAPDYAGDSEHKSAEGYPLYPFTRIEIQVRIDSAGHVVDARPASNQKKGNVLITDSALAAARTWTFEPATMHRKAIPVDYSIVFAFHPAPK